MEEEQQLQQDQQLKKSDIADKKLPKQQQQIQPHQQQQQQSTIISANGIKIKSNLNPDAKEFYPAYLMHQNPFKMQDEILKHNSPKNKSLIDIGKLEVPESKTSLDIVINEIVGEGTKLEPTNDEAKVEAEREEKAKIKTTIMEIIELAENNNNDDAIKKEKAKVEEEKQEEAVVVVVSEDEERQQEKVPIDKIRKISVIEEEEIVVDEDLKDATGVDIAEIETVIECRGNAENFTNEIKTLTNVLSEEETQQLLLAETIEEIKENVCGDMIVTAECVGDVGGDVVGEKEEIGDNADVNINNDDKREMQVHQISSETTIKSTQSAGALSTPSEQLMNDDSSVDNCNEDSNTESTNTSKDNSQLGKFDKKKLEKHSTMKKFSNMALALSRKTTNTMNSSCEKTPTKNSSTSSNMSRTKRISESLHNLSTALKSKTDIKKTSAADGVTKVIPRSNTNIPKPPVRSRTLLSKNTTQQPSNGTSKEPRNVATAAANTKDTVSLKSTGSNEKTFAPRTSVHGGSSKGLTSKTSLTSTKALDRPSSTATSGTAKTKEAVGKLPRGTVASSLRQTEAQKRRNLFPNDDPDSNIELSQFLFK